MSAPLPSIRQDDRTARARLLFYLLGALIVDFTSATRVRCPASARTDGAAVQQRQRARSWTCSPCSRAALAAAAVDLCARHRAVHLHFHHPMRHDDGDRADAGAAEEGNAGQRKDHAIYTRYLTVVLATFQSVSVSIALQGVSAGGQAVVPHPGIGFVAISAITLVSGTLFP